MKRSAIYTAKEKFWGIFMILALLWLTVSLPVVDNARDQLAGQTSSATVPTDDNPVEESEDNPLSNSVEEKCGNTSLLEEYIHHSHEPLASCNLQLSHIDSNSYDLYIAFHGELLSPPPESLLS